MCKELAARVLDMVLTQEGFVYYSVPLALGREYQHTEQDSDS